MVLTQTPKIAAASVGVTSLNFDKSDMRGRFIAAPHLYTMTGAQAAGPSPDRRINDGIRRLVPETTPSARL